MSFLSLRATISEQSCNLPPSVSGGSPPAGNEATVRPELAPEPGFGEAVELEYENHRIGELIRTLRHQHNMTQEELARRLKTTKSAISRLGGRRGTQVSSTPAIAHADGLLCESA